MIIDHCFFRIDCEVSLPRWVGFVLRGKELNAPRGMYGLTSIPTLRDYVACAGLLKCGIFDAMVHTAYCGGIYGLLSHGGDTRFSSQGGSAHASHLDLGYVVCRLAACNYMSSQMPADLTACDNFTYAYLGLP